MTSAGWLGQTTGQGWDQVLQFLVALALSALIGLERQLKRKAAGLRTYSTVGAGAALFTLVSKYGFFDVLHEGTVVLDPSRVAAQIVSGLGFIGAGVIFVHRGSVQGLTTAATIWLTAAVGSAAAAGLPLLAVVAVAGYFCVSYAVRPLLGRLPSQREVTTAYRIVYQPGLGLLRTLVDQCTRAGFSVTELRTLTAPSGDAEHAVEIALTVQGHHDPVTLRGRLAGVDGVLACNFTDVGEE